MVRCEAFTEYSRRYLDTNLSVRYANITSNGENLSSHKAVGWLLLA